MDIYIFVDNICIEIFQCEPNKKDEINEYLEELENNGTKYTIRVAENNDIRSTQMIKPRKLKNLKKGEYFTLRPISNPKESQVYIRGEYDRYEKKYECIQFSDMCSTRYIKGDKEVYTDFIF